MADNFSKWLGGENFIWKRQWGCGRTNNGEDKLSIFSSTRT